MSRPSWHLDRRTFLRGLGVVCALPYLEGMSCALEGRPRPKRLCFVSFPNGCSLPETDDEAYAHWRWFPSGEGVDFRFTRVLASLEPYRERLSILGGLSHPKSRELLGHLAGDTFLTAGDLRGDAYENTISVDQVAARSLRSHTRYPSLVLSTDGGVGYRSRVSTLSFNERGRPIPAEHRHRQVFERYFAPGAGGTSAERRASLGRSKRIVDLVLEDSRDLRRRLSRLDKDKLDEYLESLRAVEEQIERNEAWLDVPLPAFDRDRLDLDTDPSVDPVAYLRTTYDLLALAFELDLTRVATYQLGREDGMGFGDRFPSLALGIERGHHTISHDTHEGHWDDWGRFDTWYAEQFAGFLARLAELRDDHGPLLDSTAVLYGSSCSTTHNARNCPIAICGGHALGLAHGRYTVYDERTPLSNLFVSLLHAVDVDVETFGDSTGRLEALHA